MRNERKMTTPPSRRDVLRGRARGPEVHIASILVQAWPDRLPAVEAELSALTGVESHGSNGAGKLILTLETRGDAELMERVRQIETAEGVIAASLVYHHAEEMDDDS
ncbi:MAG: chaperone NapD [Kiloniellales bacterium]|nr:chaperone NapD [Kiloniellales bacterium]